MVLRFTEAWNMSTCVVRIKLYGITCIRHPISEARANVGRWVLKSAIVNWSIDLIVSANCHRRGHEQKLDKGETNNGICHGVKSSTQKQRMRTGQRRLVRNLKP